MKEGGVIMQAVSPVGEAVAFVGEYAKTHAFFTSDEVCQEYKAAGLPAPDDPKGWRDKWAVVMRYAVQAGFIKKAGKAIPTNRVSHMNSTVLWQSCSFVPKKGEAYPMMETGAEAIERLRKAWVTKTHKGDLRALLWKAYEIGFDQAVSQRPKP